MPYDQPLSRGARRLLVRLCRTTGGVSLEGLDGEAVAAAGELFDADAIRTLADADTIEPAAWAVAWLEKAKAPPSLEILETDLGRRDDEEPHGSNDDHGPEGFSLEQAPCRKKIDPCIAAMGREMEEARSRRGDYKAVNLPPPTVILGISPQWPEALRRIPCGGCQGRKLPKTWYCALDGCERSGLDNVLGKPEKSESTAPPPEWPPPRGLAGGTGKASAG